MEPYITTEPERRPVSRTQRLRFTHGTVRVRISLSGRLKESDRESADILSGNAGIVAHTLIIHQLNNLFADPAYKSNPEDTLDAGAKYEMRRQLVIGGKRVTVQLAFTLTRPAAISHLTYIADGAFDSLHPYLVNAIAPASAAAMQKMASGESDESGGNPGNEKTGFYL